MAKKDEVLNINVSGKKFTVRKSTLTADQGSKLAEWFKGTSTKNIPQDKSGNYFIDRDAKTFRTILTYLRFRKERRATALALPMKPDDLTRLIGEADALRLNDLKTQCLDMLNRYRRENELTHTVVFINGVTRAYEDNKGGGGEGAGQGIEEYADW